MPRRLPTRRHVLRAAASIGIVALTADSQAQPGSARPTTTPLTPYYYVDGYHGGVDGHMPAGSLRDVLSGLDRFPKWKVSFEIEPYSWAVFAKSDVPSIDKLRQFLDDTTPAGRVELVSGAYGQTYGWNINGESNVRQLMYGREEIWAVFPKAMVDTYAVQEPCWTSCLPQLLKSLGYRRAVLKNSTCWGGYHAATVDADLVNWVGPDGTGIPTVPRYACEKLVGPATEENAQPTEEFVKRCRAAGIANPAGTILQDMGWAGRPWRLGMTDRIVQSMKHVIWREYVDTIAAAPAKDWKSSQEDMRVGLAWGSSILQRIAQIVRADENQILQAEKLASMAKIRRGLVFPADALKQAWKFLLRAQHHDVWIVPYNRRPGGTWASEADARHEIIDQTCKQIIRDSIAAMNGGADPAATGTRFARVFNTTGSRRRDMVRIELGQQEEARGFIVRDDQGKASPCQRISDGEDAAVKASLIFVADVPSAGYATYRLETLNAEPARPQDAATGIVKSDGTVILETDLYSLSIDPRKGGRIARLFSKDLNREFVDGASPRGFNEFRGFFPSEDKWLSSTDSPARITIAENGPLRVAVRVTGQIGLYPFETLLALVTGQRRIDVQTSFDFPIDAPAFARGSGAQRFRVGESWERGREVTRSNRRPHYDSSYKLQALFPVALRQPRLHKNAAFDVCRSTLEDTQFNTWDTIKHNVIVNWIDLVADDGAAGLAVMSDHTTAYHFGKAEPLGLVMCYAGPGNWFDYALGRAPKITYGLVPHAGDWAAGRLWRELSQWSEPLIGNLTTEPANDDKRWSLIDVSDDGLELTTLFDHAADTLVRLFNAEANASPKSIRLASNIQAVELVELDGRLISELPIETSNGERRISLAIPRFGIRTLKLHL